MARKEDFDWRDVFFADEAKIETSAHSMTIRKSNAKLVIFMVEWSFKSEQG